MTLLNALKTKAAGNAFFVFVFISLFFYYNLNETLFYPPQSLHIWRQTNCLSLTQNYYQYNVPFLQPEMHNQLCDDGTSGKVVGEFPVIYYVVAQVWKLFGKHEWIFKLLQITILFLGLFSLFHFTQRILHNRFFAVFVSLLLFTSPMIIYYGPNFLPDVPGLSFVFMAWYFTARYFDKRKIINLWISASLFCLAMLLKITSALSFFALGGWVLYEIIFQEKDKRFFRFGFKQILPFIISFVLVVSWYLYVEYFNALHKGSISYHGIWPVWKMQKEQFLRIMDVLDKIYFKEMFLPVTQYITVAIWLFLIVTIKKLHPFSRYLIVIMATGFVIQLMLWFQVLEGHDYYQINLLVVLVSVWIIFLKQINNMKPVVKYIAYTLAIAFFVFNAVTCKHRASERYVGWMNGSYENNMKALISIQPLFMELGITENDKVISIPDPSINASLYYMNRKGYTDYGSDFSKTEGFYQRIGLGAKYLIVNDSTLLSKEYLTPLIQKKIGQHQNVTIFDIQNLQP